MIQWVAFIRHVQGLCSSWWGGARAIQLGGQSGERPRHGVQCGAAGGRDALGDAIRQVCRAAAASATQSQRFSWLCHSSTKADTNPAESQVRSCSGELLAHLHLRSNPPELFAPHEASLGSIPSKSMTLPAHALGFADRDPHALHLAVKGAFLGSWVLRLALRGVSLGEAGWRPARLWVLHHRQQLVTQR